MFGSISRYLCIALLHFSELFFSGTGTTIVDKVQNKCAIYTQIVDKMQTMYEQRTKREQQVHETCTNSARKTNKKCTTSFGNPTRHKKCTKKYTKTYNNIISRWHKRLQLATLACHDLAGLLPNHSAATLKLIEAAGEWPARPGPKLEARDPRIFHPYAWWDLGLEFGTSSVSSSSSCCRTPLVFGSIGGYWQWSVWQWSVWQGCIWQGCFPLRIY